jgi:hypothetical protein
VTQPIRVEEGVWPRLQTTIVVRYVRFRWRSPREANVLNTMSISSFLGWCHGVLDLYDAINGKDGGR